MNIIACDFDGTLFQENGIGVSDEDKAAIVEFRKGGGLFGIATGRDYTAAGEVFDALPDLLDFLICSTGAIICDKSRNIVFQVKSYEVDAICDIADYSLKHNLNWFCVINEDKRYYLDNCVAEYKKLSEFNNCTVWFKSIEDAENVENYIRKHHSEHFTFFRNFECIEITPLGVTKATAVRKLSTKFDIPSVFTIGDGTTDIPMVTEFNGFAVENANILLKNVAKHRCNRVCDMIDMILNDRIH